MGPSINNNVLQGFLLARTRGENKCGQTNEVKKKNEDKEQTSL